MSGAIIRANGRGTDELLGIDGGLTFSEDAEGTVAAANVGTLRREAMPEDALSEGLAIGARAGGNSSRFAVVDCDSDPMGESSNLLELLRDDGSESRDKVDADPSVAW